MVRNFNLNIPATATRTVPLMRATKPGRLVKASFFQELDADGTKTVQVRNATRGVNMSAALDVAALAAQAGAAIVCNSDGSADFNENDLLVLVYTVTVAGAVAPGDIAVELDLTEGIAYAAEGIGG